MLLHNSVGSKLAARLARWKCCMGAGCLCIYVYKLLRAALNLLEQLLRLLQWSIAGAPGNRAALKWHPTRALIQKDAPPLHPVSARDSQVVTVTLATAPPDFSFSKHSDLLLSRSSLASDRSSETGPEDQVQHLPCLRVLSRCLRRLSRAHREA